MPNVLNNAYASLSDMHEAMRLNDTSNDDRLILCLNAASRAIDNYCERKFWKDSVPESKVYVATSMTLVEIDDVQDLTGFTVKTDPYNDGTFPITWDASEYQLEPLNAMYDGQPWAYTKIRAKASKLFPVYGGIAIPQPFAYGQTQVTALFGWSNTPDDVRKACIIEAQFLFKVDDAPFGATAFNETGILRLKDANTVNHPTARALLGPYTSGGVLVG